MRSKGFCYQLSGKPEFVFKSWGNVIQLGDRRFIGDPITELKKIFRERRGESGGAVGYIGYDTVRLWENIGNHAEKDIDIPDIYLLFSDMSEAGPRSSRSYYQASGFRPMMSREAFITAREYLAACCGDESASNSSRNKILRGLPREYFIDMVLKAKEYIAAGDIYQANLSQRLSADFYGDSWELFERLCEINPSPFAGFMDLDGLQLISCSPERLVKVEGRKIETRPIAGTYPRGKTTVEDIELAQNLVLNPKERAEHIMLVDLERNDLGRVCRYGTVVVDELMVVESYSHVHHIVSNISGELEDGVDQLDVLKAIFPGGTITGCPKIRCMQIIDELEPVRRNVYTGSMGWFGYNGDMELNIIIRTILRIGNKLYLHVGAGIVADSVPEREYDETLYKAGALMDALNGSDSLVKRQLC